MGKKVKSKQERLLDYIQDYMRACAKIMRLGHHIIQVERELLEDPEDQDEADYMRIYQVPHQKRVWVGVGQCFIDAKPDMKRQIVAHELSHIHTGRITSAAKMMFESCVAPNMKDTLFAPIKAADELTADELGYVIAPLLPEWNPPDDLG